MFFKIIFDYRLYDLGHTLVGVDSVEQAITDFYNEQQLDYTVEPVKSVKGALYKVWSLHSFGMPHHLLS